MTREGYIEKIIYSNEENGYAVFEVSGEDGEEIFVGNVFGVAEGLYIIAEGEYVNHSKYDIQFKLTSCELKFPEDTVGIERYLGSGIIKGIGEVLAKRIVKKFKSDTLRVIEEEPIRLAEISGISERKARTIAVSYAEKKEFQEVIIFLSQYGISINLAIKIYENYGDKVYEIIKGNPYKIAEDVSGVGFKIADQIARKMGIPSNSVYRLRSSLLYVLNMSQAEGHMYLPKDTLIRKAIELTKGSEWDLQGNSYDDFSYGYAEYVDSQSGSTVYEEMYELMNSQLVELATESKIIEKNIEGVLVIYSSVNYYIELNSARMLLDLQLKYDVDEEELDNNISVIQKKNNIELDEVQEQAVKEAIKAGVAVITGGPGTGKTTIIDVIIKYFTSQGMEIKLCAPTGRAAKRMTEQTGWPAETIHRMLEFNGAIDSGDDKEDQALKFGRNEGNPLECDAIIVDEMSMVDSFIFHSLLKAIVHGTRLILVGDVHQLPSVGAGNVLKDIINSGCFPVTTLSKIFRQGEGSDIIYNAHKINRGEHIEIHNKSKDFFFIPRNGVANIIEEVKVLVSDNLPKYLKLNPEEIQILTPMRKGDVGVSGMNEKLQALLNPEKPGKPQKIKNDVVFREGDKVMQIKNDYKQEWKIYSNKGKAAGYVVDEGVGVFNGDVGTITEISDYDEEVTVLFDDGREAVYSYNNLNQLEHAFAVTIHKSQGSEYPAVIIPLLSGPPKLLNRNLLYTAITRAKQMVVIVGNINLVNQMIDNLEEQKRFTSLDLRIQEMMDYDR
ncbi:MAG: ATP-dependent RecD-like DNA helicase [Lachnospiraceae bacterium]|nr:ATP-dependent RecD-like DNA helicase [Lachnospiraceae bacterium]